MMVLDQCTHVRAGQPVAREIPVYEGLRVELCAACLTKLRNECRRPR